MSGWIGWLVPVVMCVLLGFGATLYLQRVRLPQEETTAGIAALAGMRWRDFIHLVLAAMNARGYERVFVPNSTSDESDYLLERDGQRWLLSSKHGTAYVLGSSTISKVSVLLRMAPRGWLSSWAIEADNSPAVVWRLRCASSAMR